MDEGEEVQPEGHLKMLDSYVYRICQLQGKKFAQHHRIDNSYQAIERFAREQLDLGRMVVIAFPKCYQWVVVKVGKTYVQTGSNMSVIQQSLSDFLYCIHYFTEDRPTVHLISFELSPPVL